MLISHRDTCERSADYDHRPGGINLIQLQNGTEFAPDNFQLYLIEAREAFETPRHRHNFEQVRIMLDGDFEWSPGRVQQPGTVGYFTEGTFYTQKGRGDSKMLLLQVAGAGGDGYMSPRQLRQGIEDLKSEGEFREGIFYRLGPDNTNDGRDSYEAVWEHVNGRSLSYPKPRYDGPIMIQEQAFGWIERAAEPGVEERPFGRFNERGLTIGMLRVAAGSTASVDARDQTKVLYAVSGTGSLADGSTWTEGSALQLSRGERAELTAKKNAEFYTFGIPVFD